MIFALLDIYVIMIAKADNKIFLDCFINFKSIIHFRKTLWVQKVDFIKKM